MSVVTQIKKVIKSGQQSFENKLFDLRGVDSGSELY